MLRSRFCLLIALRAAAAAYILASLVVPYLRSASVRDEASIWFILPISCDVWSSSDMKEGQPLSELGIPIIVLALYLPIEKNFHNKIYINFLCFNDPYDFFRAGLCIM